MRLKFSTGSSTNNSNVKCLLIYKDIYLTLELENMMTWKYQSGVLNGPDTKWREKKKDCTRVKKLGLSYKLVYDRATNLLSYV